mgnify:CR=1 FL=1
MLLRGTLHALIRLLERAKPGAGIQGMRRGIEEALRKSGGGYDAARALLEDLARAERSLLRIAERYVEDVDQGRVRTAKDAERYIDELWTAYNHEVRPRRDRLIKLLRTV